LFLFPVALDRLNLIVADLIYKIDKINSNKSKERFSRCPAHVRVKHNEKIDLLAKEAAIRRDVIIIYPSRKQ